MSNKMYKSPARRGAAKGLIITILLIVVGIVGWRLPATQAWIAEWSEADSSTDSKYILHDVEMGSFRITITENGTVDSLRNATLKSDVEGSTTIISLVPEGSRVNGPIVSEIDGTVEFGSGESESAAEKTLVVRAEDGTTKTYTVPMGEFTEILIEDRSAVKAGDYLAGDMLCELDSSSLTEKKQQQDIDVTGARANLEKAQKTLEIQETTNESNLAKAKLAEKLAKLDLEKYVADGGEYQQSLETLEGEIRKNEEDLAMAQESYDQVRDQARRGYKNLNNLERSRLEVSQKKITLTVKESELNLLKKFTKERQVSELQQQAEDTVRETSRAKLEGEAEMAGFKADFYAREQMLVVEEEKLSRLLRQIKACRLIAPQAGEVVYASQESRRSEPVVIEEGATVRERQAIINLPDLDSMKVDARIHESRISRIMIGQPVEISIDAVNSVMFHGVLETVSAVPVPGSWPNTDLKEYEAAIRITDSADMVRKLKPGMTAEIRIIVDDRQEDVLQVPVQSVLALADKFFTYAVDGRNVERRELIVGDANDEYMEIIDGVAEGEQVVMNPRTHFSREINDLESELNAAQEANRERVSTPKGKSGQGGAGGAGRPAGGGQAKQGGGRPTAGGAGGGAPGGGGGMPDPKTIFDRMDKNKDGFITKDESDLMGKFDERDTDKDSKISLEELKAAFSGR